MAERGIGLRILLAEDEAMAALVVGDALNDMGHAVVHAADGETALGLAAAMPFDVLVTDLAMPRLTGPELIRQLRTERPDLPVVMMTGWLPPEAAELLGASGADHTTLLLKPFALTHLAEALARVMAHQPDHRGTGDHAAIPGRTPPAGCQAAPAE